MKQFKVLFVWFTHKGISSKIIVRTPTFSRSAEVLRCCLDSHRKGFITITRTHPSYTPLTLYHLPAHVKGFILIAKNWTKFCAGSFGPLVVTVCWRFWLKASGYHGSTSIMAIPLRPPPRNIGERITYLYQTAASTLSVPPIAAGYWINRIANE